MGAFVILLREAFEASLVLGLVFAYLDRTGQRATHGRVVWLGAAAAVVFSVVLGALLFLTVGELDGTAAKVYEGTAMLIAAVMLTWMVFWMKAQSRTIGGTLRTQVGSAIASGGGLALALVAFVAVAREGVESALFLFVSVGDNGLLPTVIGAALGLAVALALGLAFYRGSLKLDLRKFFLVTGLLVIAFAAYLLVGGLQELAEAGGGEALETAGPLLAIVFAGVLGWFYVRGPKPRTPGAA
jgi:high-affinity iron transporter